MTAQLHGVIALDVNSPDLDLSTLLRGTANHFRPHITLVPRFPIKDLETAVVRWSSIVCDLNLPSNQLFRLSGPKWPEPDLCWYDFEEDADGRKPIMDAHHQAISQAMQSRQLDTYPNFSGNAFHPHMTVTWRAEPPGGLPAALTLRRSAITLYSYTKDPHQRPVSRNIISDQ